MDYKRNYYKLHTDFHEKDSKEKAKVISMLLNNFNDFKLKSIIDVGCGSGMVLLDVIHSNNFNRVVGVDISEDAIKRAVMNDSRSEVKWIWSDFKDIKEAMFDVVLLIDIVEHTYNDKHFINSLRNIGKVFIIKVPIERNIINGLIKFISFGRIDLYKINKKKYGHIQNYTEKSFLETLKDINFKIIKIEYMHLPKRSKIGWEVLRILSYPFWFISRRFYILFNGGFLVVMVKSNNVDV